MTKSRQRAYDDKQERIDPRGDVNQELLLAFGFFCFYAALFGLDHTLFLSVFVDFPLRDIGL